ncbi:MAG: phytanoyl-CoA dioxygenase family protein [Candidatus Latescibacteria bacterium]|nr:phytanoyl-CoA dioxygenase family protein [Candidatus Latescibacterota bacterium]
MQAKIAQDTFTFQGSSLETAPEALGELRHSDDAHGDYAELRRRMQEDGYLFLPGLLDREAVLTARREIAQRLADAGHLHPDHPSEACIAAPGARIDFLASVAQDNPQLDAVLYAGSMMEFYQNFLGGPVRHYDYTWFRVKTPDGRATEPHYDVVYMGRGTRQLYTSWTPFSDVEMDMGGLMVLENSHRQQELISTYGQTDVDRYCENDATSHRLLATAREQQRDLTSDERRQVQWQSPTFGAYSPDAVATRQTLGGRWLTAEYRMGDLLIFSMYTMHASADNHTEQIRLSSDSRYQLASESIDDRWIGEDPPAHGIRAHQSMIC